MSLRATPIAVVGVSGLFPGALTTEDFWRDIATGKDRITDVPRTHWLREDYFHPKPGTPDKVYATRGGFIDPVEFSPLEFGLPPSTLPAIDTAQLLALIVAKRVLAEATRGRYETMDRSRMSVVLGVASATELVGHMSGRLQIPLVARALRASGFDEDAVTRVCGVLEASYVPWQEGTFPGLLGNVVAGRIANRLDLGGTNAVVDAACASSLAAIDMAVNELSVGRSDLVVTGGVDALNDILMFMCFAQTGALSQSGDCRPFSQDADGTLLGEGIGMLALRRLSDAERDGDPVYAVIRGIGSSSDGRGKSIYAPVPAGQALALRRAYERAGFGPETVELVEAHGTATKAGDAAELEALGTVWREAGARAGGCALGSIKGQIGHTKAAAGAAGLMKIVLALHQKVLPPTVKVTTPNASLEGQTSPFCLNTQLRPWIASGDHPRRAAVSALGFGGTNFHVAVEEYVGPAPRPERLRTSPLELVLVGAADQPALAAECRKIAESARGAGAVAHIAKKTQLAFDPAAPARIAVLASDEADLASKLRAAADGLEKGQGERASRPLAVHFGAGSLGGSVAFLFPGQGSQYVGMGRELATELDEARALWDKAARLFGGPGERLNDRVFPPPVFTDDARRAQEEALVPTQWAQPAIAATSFSMLRVLERVGLTPAFTAGHSLGEISALAAAGAFDLEAAIAIARQRGEAMAEVSRSAPGTMTAVIADRATVERLVGAWGIDVTIANDNAPRQVVLSGAAAAIEEVERRLQGEKISCRRLSVSAAFHSPLVAGAVVPFRSLLESFEVRPTRIPVFANATASEYARDPAAMRDAIAQAIARPVRFREQIEAMYAAGVRTFVEVGPESVLSRLVERTLEHQPHVAVSIDQRGKHGVSSLWDALGRLAVAGVAIDFRPLWEGVRMPEDPASRVPPKLTAMLVGANYGKPARPEPSRGDVQVAPARAPAPKTNGHAAHGAVSAAAPPATQPAANGYHGPASPAATRAPNPSAPPLARVAPAALPPTSLAARNAPVVAPAPTSSVPPPAPGSAAWVAAIQALQEPVIAAQREYQRLMAESHVAFLRATAITYGSALDGSTLASAPLPHDALSIASHMPAPAVHDDPVVLPAPPAPVHAANAHAAHAPPPAPVPHAPPPPKPALDLVPIMLAVVAEKTGYPAEMIDLGMDLESDLGIDSIKRVEILSAVREKVPSLPEVDTARMATLRTLGEIVAVFGATAPATPAAAAPEARAPASSLVPIMLAVVAEKTGYPAEMIDLGMDLESDLGIDSIKRVEILSAVREKVPSLPEVDTARMATLRTLGEIVAVFGATPGSASAPAAPTSPAAPAASPAPVTSLVPLVLAVVAEKTGYPAEMIDLTMDLERDLGIDSIKRVEILSAVRERAPGLPEVDASRLATLRSLAEIVSYLSPGGSAPEARPAVAAPTSSEARAPAQGAPAHSSPQPSSAARGEIHRSVVRAVPTPAPGFAVPGLFGPGKVLVVGDGTSLASAVIARLRARRVSAVEVSRATRDASAVIFLGGLRPVARREDALAINRQAFDAARTVAPRFAAEGGTFVTVQDTGGDFGLSGGAGDRAWLGGIGALAKTAAREWPRAFVRAIDLARGGRSDDEAAEALVAELLQGGTDLEVGLGLDGARIVVEATKEPVGDATARIEPGAVFVVSGGARGVTAEALVALASTARPRFVLLGRTPLVDEPAAYRGVEDGAALKRLALDDAKRTGAPTTPRAIGQHVDAILAGREVRRTLERLAEAGAEARYVAVNVRDRAALHAALAAARAELGPIRGLVHGAGLLADALLQNKTDEHFDRVFDTKVLGLAGLLDATAEDPLEWIGIFSSIAARVGNAGQADYAMANEVLNKVAAAEARRRGERCRVVSIGWGPWQGGMVTGAVEKQFEARGVELLPKAAGADAFVRELVGARDVEVVIGVGDLDLGAKTKRIEVDVLVDESTYPQLASHRVRGAVVLPAVLPVEWFARLALRLLGAAQMAELEVHDLRVLRGVLLHEYSGEGARFRIVGELTPDGSRASFELRDEAGVRRYSATVSRAAGPRTRPPRSPADVSRPWTPAEVYGPAGLFHGRDFQVIRSVEGTSERAARAELVGTRELGWPGGDWLTDPAAMDGAIQLGFLVGIQAGLGPTLPMRIGRIGFGDAAGARPLACDAYVHDRSKERLVCDLSLVGPDGTLVVGIDGLELYALSNGAA